MSIIHSARNNILCCKFTYLMALSYSGSYIFFRAKLGAILDATLMHFTYGGG